MRQSRPVVVVVAGQPGAGKSEIADLVQAALDRRVGATRVGRDLYKPVHLRYAEFLAADARTAGVKVRPETSRWQADVEAHVRACGFDVVVESAIADPLEGRGADFGERGRVRIVAVWAAGDDLAMDDALNDAAVEPGSEWGQYERVTNTGFAA